MINASIRESVSYSEMMINLFFEFPVWFKNLLPFACLLGTLFSLEGLKSRNELVAIVSLGYSSKRIVIDIFQIASFITVVMLINNFILIPRFSKMRLDWLKESRANFKEKTIGDNDVTTSFGDRFWVKTKNKFYSFAYYDKETDSLKDIAIYNVEDGKVKEIIKGARSSFLEKNDWKIEDGHLLSGLSNVDFPQTSPIGDGKIDLGISIKQLDWVGEKIKTMSLWSLLRYMFFLNDSDVDINALMVYIASLINSALICLIFSLIPLNPLFDVNRRAGGIGKNAAFTLIFSVLYWIINSFFVTLGTGGKINPLIAVFFTTSLFVVYIFYQVRKKLSLMS